MSQNDRNETQLKSGLLFELLTHKMCFNRAIIVIHGVQRDWRLLLFFYNIGGDYYWE